MSLARKDLELRMTVTTDATKATAVMQQLTRDAERAGLAVKSIGTGPGGGVPGGGGGGGGGVIGLVRGAAGGAAGVLAGAAALVSTAAGVHKAFLDLDSSLLTVREKTLGFAKAIPLVGDALSSFIGNLMDARDRMLNPEQYKNVQQMRAENPIKMAQMSARSEFEQRIGGWNRELSGARYNSQAVRELPTIASGQAGLRSSIGGMAGTFLGAGLDSIDPRLSAAMESIQDAKRGHRGAELGAAESAAEVVAARAKSDRLQREWRMLKSDSEASLDAARGGGMGQSRSDQAGQAAFDRFGFYSNPEAGYLRRFGNELGAVTIGTTARAIGRMMPDQTLDGRDKGSDLSLEEARLREQKAAHALGLANADLEEKMRKSKGDQLASAQKLHEINKAETGLMKTQLQIMDEQIAKTRGGMQQFGAMDSVSQNNLFQAAKRFKTGGRESVTADEFQMLAGSSLTRDLVGKQAEEDAKSNPMYQALEKLLGLRDLDMQRTERDEFKAKLDVKVQFDEQKFADQMKEALEKMNFRELFIKILEVKTREAEVGNLKMRASANQ